MSIVVNQKNLGVSKARRKVLMWSSTFSIDREPLFVTRDVDFMGEVNTKRSRRFLIYSSGIICTFLP